MEISKPHVLVLASPGIGHLIPVLQLAKRLVSFDTLRVTLFYVSTESSTSQAELISLSSKFHQDLEIIDLTPPNVSDSVPADLVVEIRILMMMQQSMSPLASRIASMDPLPCAIIVDLFGFDAFAVADRFGVSKYIFVTSNAWFLASVVYTPIMDQEVVGQYVDQTDPIPIPGCKPIPPGDVVDALLDRDLHRYQLHLGWCRQMVVPDGLIINTWQDLEPQTIGALGGSTLLGKITKPPVYPIGPIVRTVAGPGTACNDVCLDWLSRQPGESVLYVSFGSGGTQSRQQMTELAWGLLMSQLRFVWVVRPPSENDPSGTFFSSTKKSLDPSEYLPDGFLAQMNGLGMVVPNWAPQEHILAHPAIGGFLSHCGWNSTLESMINGVPMIAWPLYAEQKMNATMLAEDFGIAVKADLVSSMGIVSRDEINKMVRLVMVSEEGKRMRENVRELKKHALEAIDKHGSSYNTTLELIKEITISTK